MCVGIPNSGYTGWIVAVGHFGTEHGNTAVGIIACVQAALFTFMATVSLILLKKVRLILVISFSKERLEKNCANFCPTCCVSYDVDMNLYIYPSYLIDLVRLYTDIYYVLHLNCSD